LKKIAVDVVTVMAGNGDELISDIIFDWIFHKLNTNKLTPGLTKEQECEKKIWVLYCIEKVN